MRCLTYGLGMEIMKDNSDHVYTVLLYRLSKVKCLNVYKKPDKILETQNSHSAFKMDISKTILLMENFVSLYSLLSMISKSTKQPTFSQVLE